MIRTIAAIIVSILVLVSMTPASAEHLSPSIDGQGYEWDTNYGKYVDTRWRKYTETYAYVITLADWLQTRQIKDTENVYESNDWICGKQPDSDCVAVWMLAKIAGIYYLNNVSNWNPTTKYKFNIFYSVTHTHAVYNNLSLGLEIRF